MRFSAPTPHGGCLCLPHGKFPTRKRNAVLRSLRCLGERGFALLTGRWRTLQHITASPSKISNIFCVVIVLTHLGHSYIK